MLNGIPGKRAIIVKTMIKNSPNIGKIVELSHLISEEEKRLLRIRPSTSVWVVDKDILWEYFNGERKYHKCVPDDVIRLLPDLDEEVEKLQDEIVIVD
ncbi:hypothetical protein [Synechococcus phage BUCT-ZZ01]|nr:hypothetical protein [Synechococcus phage BUCT-ZZ01]